VAPPHRGGVNQAVAAVAPHLAVSLVGTKPWSHALRAVTHGAFGVVHLHPSLRPRAVARDSLLHAAARYSGAATVVHWHGWDPQLAGTLDRSRLARTALRAGLGRADMTAVTTAAHRRSLIAWGVPEPAVQVVPNAFDPGRIPNERRPGSRPVVLFVGRLTPEKGVVPLVDAFARAGVDGRLVLVGDGPARAEIEARVARLRLGERVVLTGWVDGPTLRGWLGQAAMLVLPSEQESAPIAVIEALAARVPVIAAPVGGIPELVGEAGIVLPHVDVASLAEAIRSVVERPPVAAVGRAAARIWQDHHPAAVAARWEGLHTEALRAALARRRAR
jgi:glycosyltransferase involved in cell wall biosynthesis